MWRAGLLRANRQWHVDRGATLWQWSGLFNSRRGVGGGCVVPSPFHCGQDRNLTPFHSLAGIARVLWLVPRCCAANVSLVPTHAVEGTSGVLVGWGSCWPQVPHCPRTYPASILPLKQKKKYVTRASNTANKTFNDRQSTAAVPAIFPAGGTSQNSNTSWFIRDNKFVRTPVSRYCPIHH